MFEDIKEIKNKNILVIGLGKSGIAVIKRLAGLVKSITAIDTNPFLNINGSFKKFKNLKNFQLKFILDEKSNEMAELLENSDIVITSPGIACDIPVIQAADAKRIAVWSEIELGWRFLTKTARKNTIAVTGTNGKTTVVTLIQQIFKDSGMHAIVCGNIGNPLINTIDAENDNNLIRIIEISSFQLERVYQFNPYIGILLNITSDHLDRHHSMNKYAEIKFNLFSNMGDGQWGIFNTDDKYIEKKLNDKNYYKNKEFNIVGYSIRKSKNSQVYYSDNKIHYDLFNNSGEIDISKIKLAGFHNVSNVMSVICAVKIFGVDNQVIEKTLRKFGTLKHRIEFVADIDGVKIFNDSKATNPDATIKALESFNEKITLILGGKDKGMDFSPVVPYIEGKVSNLILIGETKKKIIRTLANYNKRLKKIPYKVITCDDFKDAVYTGLKVTNPGNVFLLSPACASFDMFKDYKDRGEKFKKIVLEYKSRMNYARG